MELGTLAGSTVGAIALLVVFGIPPLVARATIPATAAEAVAGVIRSLTLFAMPYFVVPLFQRIFADFGAELSVVTESIFWASSAAVTILLPTFLLLFAGETIAFYLLYRNPEQRRQAHRLSIFMTVASCVAVLLFTVAIGVPLLELVSQLS